ncbi:MAG: carboxypeptidase-like regulatory domain-containing protein, partial [Ignavibacteriaceae bacterium]
MRRKITNGIFLFLMISGINYIFAQNNQTGSLSGTITGADTKAPLSYANVIIVGTSNGLATDANGKYLIRNIAAGEQKVQISYVGYITKTIDVIISPNKTTELNVSLEITAVQGSEVVVTAQRAGQQGAINQQINSNTIKNVVAADRLQQNPDANVSEAIGRLPGISLNRTGGEGTGIVIRGLDPKYNKVLIDGVTMPSTNANDRATGISGISQYVLQGVEVYKSITADMEGDATAGAINLKFGETPTGFNFNVMAQGGYNDLNKYWKNYKFESAISNRFFNDKLGVTLNLSAENVNRSAQTLSAAYDILSAPTDPNQFLPMYVSSINLNDVYRINKRNSGTLVFDYKLSPISKIEFSNFFSNFTSDIKTVSKVYNLTNGGINYSFNNNPNSATNLFLTSLRSENKFNLFDLNAGLSFSQTHVYTPDNRGWGFVYPNGIPKNYVSQTSRQLPLETLVSAVGDSVQGSDLQKITANSVNAVSENNINKQTSAYFDINIPYNFATISGNLKLGTKYKNQYRNRYYFYSHPVYFPTTLGNLAASYLPWVNNVGGTVSAIPFNDHVINEFLNNKYYFGWYPNFDRLNKFYDFYYSVSEYYRMHPEVQSPFPEVSTYFLPDYSIMQQNNYRFNENYLGSYIMSEMNIGDLITFIPGIRYEKVFDDLWGWYYEQILNHTFLTGHPTKDTHTDEYFLPNFHLKIKPLEWLNVNLAYTNTLN